MRKETREMDADEPERGRDLVRQKKLDALEMRMETFRERATLAELVFLEDLLGFAESSRGPATECALANEALWMLGLETVDPAATAAPVS